MSMEVEILDRQRGPLATLATQTGLSTQELVVEAIDRMIAHGEWFDAQVQVGLDQIASGEFVEEDQMDERFARLLKA